MKFPLAYEGRTVYTLINLLYQQTNYPGEKYLG